MVKLWLFITLWKPKQKLLLKLKRPFYSCAASVLMWQKEVNYLFLFSFSSVTLHHREEEEHSIPSIFTPLFLCLVSTAERLSTQSRGSCFSTSQEENNLNDNNDSNHSVMFDSKLSAKNSLVLCSCISMTGLDRIKVTFHKFWQSTTAICR